MGGTVLYCWCRNSCTLFCGPSHLGNVNLRTRFILFNSSLRAISLFIRWPQNRPRQILKLAYHPLPQLRQIFPSFFHRLKR